MRVALVEPASLRHLRSKVYVPTLGSENTPPAASAATAPLQPLTPGATERTPTAERTLDAVH